MVPRADVVTLRIDQPFEEHLRRIETSDYAHYPVVKSGLDSMLGVVNARRWFSRILKGEDRSLANQPLDPPLYVPETLTGMELLDNFRSSHVHVAFVVDEYGEIQGIITLQDLIEAITGEFKPRDPEHSWAVQRDDGSWLLDGHIPVPELKDRLGLSSVPEEEHGRYHTLSGMMMLLTGPAAEGGRHDDLGRLALRDRRHGRQHDRQGDRVPPAGCDRLGGCQRLRPEQPGASTLTGRSSSVRDLFAPAAPSVLRPGKATEAPAIIRAALAGGVQFALEPFEDAERAGKPGRGGGLGGQRRPLAAATKQQHDRVLVDGRLELLDETGIVLERQSGRPGHPIGARDLPDEAALLGRAHVDQHRSASLTSAHAASGAMLPGVGQSCGAAGGRCRFQYRWQGWVGQDGGHFDSGVREATRMDAAQGLGNEDRRPDRRECSGVRDRWNEAFLLSISDPTNIGLRVACMEATSRSARAAIVLISIQADTRAARGGR